MRPLDGKIKATKQLLFSTSFIFTLLHKYCNLLISRCNFEKLRHTRECQQTLFCKQTSQVLSESPILNEKYLREYLCYIYLQCSLFIFYSSVDGFEDDEEEQQLTTRINWMRRNLKKNSFLKKKKK